MMKKHKLLTHSTWRGLQGSTLISACLTELRTVGVPLWNILDMTKVVEMEKSTAAAGARSGVARKRELWAASCGEESVLYLGCMGGYRNPHVITLPRIRHCTNVCFMVLIPY